MIDLLFWIIGGWSALILAIVVSAFLGWLVVRAFRAAVRMFMAIFIILVLTSIFARAEEKDTKSRTLEELVLVGAHAFDAVTTEIWLAHDPWIDDQGRQTFPTDRNVLYRALDSPAERIAIRTAGVVLTLWCARKVENRWPTVARIIRYAHIGTMAGWGTFNVTLIVRY